MVLEIGLLVTEHSSLICRVLEINPQAFCPSHHPISLAHASISTASQELIALCPVAWYLLMYSVTHVLC